MRAPLNCLRRYVALLISHGLRVRFLTGLAQEGKKWLAKLQGPAAGAGAGAGTAGSAAAAATATAAPGATAASVARTSQSRADALLGTSYASFLHARFVSCMCDVFVCV